MPTAFTRPRQPKDRSHSDSRTPPRSQPELRIIVEKYIGRGYKLETRHENDRAV